jgi:cytochrome P450
MKSIDNALADPKTYGSPDELHRLLTQLRQNDPVHWTEPNGVRPFWLITKHADVSEIERHPAAFLNAPRIAMRTIEDEAKLAAVRKSGQSMLIRSMNGMDGAEHGATRNITQMDFLRPNIEKLSIQIDAIASEFVQRMIDKGPAFDFVREIARWYPLRVIMMQLGVPAEDEGRLLQLTEQLFGVADPEVQKQYGAPKTSAETVEMFFDYFRPLLADRRENPSDDIASRIANAKINGEYLGDFEALSYYVTIATAGHDTTAASISGGLLALIQNPLEMEKLRRDPELLKTLPDEIIRWVAPVKHFFRTAVEDYSLSGTVIRAGDNVMLSYPSACRDESVFEDPFLFRVDRTPNKHLAMGDGVHLCLGQHLARLEIRLFFKNMLHRIPELQLASTPAWVEGSFISGLKKLEISIAGI